MEDKIDEQVVIFLSEFCKITKNKITMDSDIAKDLKMEGDDAVELLSKFGQRFHVDTSVVNIEDYFVPEASFNPLTVLIALILGRHKKLKSMFVSNLVAAARSRIWKEES